MGETKKRLKLDDRLRASLPPELYAELKDAMVARSDDFQCAICLKDRCELPVMFKPCSHFFCIDCAARTLDGLSACPTCKGCVSKVVLPKASLPHYRGCHPSEEKLSDELDARIKWFAWCYNALRGTTYQVNTLPATCGVDKFKVAGRLTFVDVEHRRELVDSMKEKSQIEEDMKKLKKRLEVLKQNIAVQVNGANARAGMNGPR